jgi:hypothetical protein
MLWILEMSKLLEEMQGINYDEIRVGSKLAQLSYSGVKAGLFQLARFRHFYKEFERKRPRKSLTG